MIKKITTFRLSNCEIDPIEHSIIFDGEKKQTIQPKSIEVICYLAAHHPRVISREELITHIWGENSVVGDNGLTNAIWHLRKTLKAINNGGDIIETIRKVGYKLSLSPVWQEQLPVSEELTVTPPQNNVQTKPLPSKQNKLIYAGTSLFFIVLFFIWYNYQSRDFTPFVSTQITKQQGAESYPAPSPDGKFVAYRKVSIGNGNTDLYIQDVQNLQSPPKQLTFDAYREGFSVWSHSGKYLYFSRQDNEKNQCWIVKLDISSLQETKLATCQPRNSYIYLDISPDDKTLAYTHKEETDDRRGIYFIRLDQANATPIRFSCNHCDYKDRDMAFSPDGQSIAISRRATKSQYTNRHNENIFLVDLKSKISVQLTDKKEDIIGLSWHPSGKKIIYAAQRSDNRYSYILDVETKKIKNLNIPNFNYPAIARKSTHLFYQVLSDRYHISHLQLGGSVSNSPFPTLQSEFNHLNSDYSKISNRIAYSSNESGYYEVWSSDPSGANKKQLTNLKQQVLTPRWSHDGQKIAFLSPSDDGQYDISILDVKTHKVSKLSSPFKNHNRPTWSYDDKTIITNIADVKSEGLFQINIVSGKSKQLTFDKGRLGIMISPTTLLYSIPGKGLWQKNILNNTLSINVIPASLFRTRYTWVYGNNGVYFKQSRNNVYQLNFYDLTSKQNTPLIRIPKHTLRSSTALTFIENSNRLMFTSSRNPQSSIHMLMPPLIR